MTRHIVSAFPCLILESTDSEFVCKDDLVAWIYNHMENNPSHIISNRNGWQSEDGFFHNDVTFQPFMNYIAQRLNELVNECFSRPLLLASLWINVNPPGAYNVTHTHPKCDMSGCFWIDGPPNSGQFVLLNPRNHVQASLLASLNTDTVEMLNMGNVIRHDPTPGKMIIFPSDLPHMVEQNLSDQNRISIAFNMLFE